MGRISNARVPYHSICQVWLSEEGETYDLYVRRNGSVRPGLACV